MIKRSSFLFFCFLFYFLGLKVNAQKVNNVSFRQEQSNIIVSYNLETTSPCKIMLYVSTDGGKIWQGPLKHVIGDVGDKITSGNNSIIWEVLEEFKELRGNNIKFKIRSQDNYIETVIIGNQEWTTNNLNVSKYRNGDIIPEVKDLKKWDSLTSGAWCYYDNDPKNGKIYGKLYNWYAVNDPRGLAPEGYHIPSKTELNRLEEYLGGMLKAGGNMKETGTLHWHSPNVLNYSWPNSDQPEIKNVGFNALPGYQRHGRNESWVNDYIGGSGLWWTSTEMNKLKSYSFSIRNYSSFLYSNDESLKHHGLSVRCIKD